MRFYMNGLCWTVRFVPPHSSFLIDRTGEYRVATTDPNTWFVYLSDELEGEELVKVLIHEFGHCALVSFNLLDDIHRVVYPEYWIEAEEWICNFISDYGRSIFSAASSVLGNKAIELIPRYLEYRLGERA